MDEMPEETGLIARMFTPSKKVTCPVGLELVTEAVKVKGAPNVEGFAELPSVMVVVCEVERGTAFCAASRQGRAAIKKNCLKKQGRLSADIGVS
jgi:hypothetical protein